MPNGGSDCCGTCWFNSINDGEPGYHGIQKIIDSSEQSYCLIRNETIEDPMYTYCVNHPHHNPQRIEIPIGPITTGESREIWKEPLDTEEIRQFLINYLKSIPSEEETTDYPYGSSIEEAILIHIRDLNEPRAIPELQRIANSSEYDSSIRKNPFSRDMNELIGLAIDTLTKMLREEMIPIIEAKLSSREYSIRFYAIFSLDYLSSEKSITLLKKAEGDPNPKLSKLAKDILEKKGIY